MWLTDEDISAEIARATVNGVLMPFLLARFIEASVSDAVSERVAQVLPTRGASGEMPDGAPFELEICNLCHGVDGVHHEDCLAGKVVTALSEGLR